MHSDCDSNWLTYIHVSESTMQYIYTEGTSNLNRQNLTTQHNSQNFHDHFHSLTNYNHDISNQTQCNWATYKQESHRTIIINKPHPKFKKLQQNYSNLDWLSVGVGVRGGSWWGQKSPTKFCAAFYPQNKECENRL